MARRRRAPRCAGRAGPAARASTRRHPREERRLGLELGRLGGARAPRRRGAPPPRGSGAPARGAAPPASRMAARSAAGMRSASATAGAAPSVAARTASCAADRAGPLGQLLQHRAGVGEAAAPQEDLDVLGVALRILPVLRRSRKTAAASSSLAPSPKRRSPRRAPAGRRGATGRPAPAPARRPAAGPPPRRRDRSRAPATAPARRAPARWRGRGGTSRCPARARRPSGRPAAPARRAPAGAAPAPGGPSGATRLGWSAMSRRSSARASPPLAGVEQAGGGPDEADPRLVGQQRRRAVADGLHLGGGEAAPARQRELVDDGHGAVLAERVAAGHGERPEGEPAARRRRAVQLEAGRRDDAEAEDGPVGDGQEELARPRGTARAGLVAGAGRAPGAGAGRGRPRPDRRGEPVEERAGRDHRLGVVGAGEPPVGGAPLQPDHHRLAGPLQVLEGHLAALRLDEVAGHQGLLPLRPLGRIEPADAQPLLVGRPAGEPLHLGRVGPAGLLEPDLPVHLRRVLAGRAHRQPDQAGGRRRRAAAPAAPAARPAASRPARPDRSDRRRSAPVRPPPRWRGRSPPARAASATSSPRARTRTSQAWRPEARSRPVKARERSLQSP